MCHGMVSYHPVLHTTAERELHELDDSDRERLTETLKDVAETRSPTTHEKTKQLEGQSGLFRVRVGNIRAICKLQKPNLLVVKIGHRSSVYERIDSTLSDRLSTVGAEV